MERLATGGVSYARCYYHLTCLQLQQNQHLTIGSRKLHLICQVVLRWPMATFVNYIHTMKLHNNFGGYVYHMWFWHMWLVNQPTITVQALCQKRLNTDQLFLYDSNNTVRLFPYTELTGFCNWERVYLLCNTNKSSNKIQVKFLFPRFRQKVTNTVTHLKTWKMQSVLTFCLYLKWTLVR